MKLAIELRNRGNSVFIEHDSKSIKSQLKRSNRLDSAFTIIIGEEELQNGRVTIRNMKESTEESIDLKDTDKLYNHFT